jgi:hypothetical protein
LSVAASTQHAIGVTVLTAASAIGAVQLALPHVTTGWASLAAPLLPLAAGTAGTASPPVPALSIALGVAPTVVSVVLVAFICAGSPLLQAVAITPAHNQANIELRTFIFTSHFSRAADLPLWVPIGHSAGFFWSRLQL